MTCRMHVHTGLHLVHQMELSYKCILALATRVHKQLVSILCLETSISAVSILMSIAGPYGLACEMHGVLTKSICCMLG